MNISSSPPQKENKRIDKWLPVVLFILVGVFIFLTEKSDGGSIEGSMYGSTSAHGITLSKSLINSDHPFFMYASREIRDGKVVYDAYNRFPIFPFLLTGIMVYPFGYDLTLQIYVARQIMNFFFFLSLIVVFKLVDELVNNKYLALTVSLVVFSSYYIFSYNDMIFNDIPALLGFVVALYGVIMFQKSKLKTSSILFFILFPVSLGWQPYAVYLTWCLVDTIELLLKKKTSIRMKISTLFRQRSILVTVTAIVWGILILGLQLLNEWRIVGGSFLELPSVSSGLWRSGLVSAEGHTTLLWTFDWLTYLPGQFHSITLMLIPFWPIFQVELGFNASIVIVISSIIFILFKYLKNRNIFNKSLLIMILSGLLWTIPMKHFVALHDFQSVFYIGFAVTVWITILHRITQLDWRFFSIIITITFLISVSLSNHFKTPFSGILTTQFQNINDQLPLNSKVYFDGDRHRMTGFSKYAMNLFLLGSVFTQLDEADYIISKNPDIRGKMLTTNSGFNLFKVNGN